MRLRDIRRMSSTKPVRVTANPRVRILSDSEAGGLRPMITALMRGRARSSSGKTSSSRKWMPSTLAAQLIVAVNTRVPPSGPGSARPRRARREEIEIDAGIDRLHRRQTITLRQHVAVALRHRDHGVVAGQAFLLQPRHLAALVRPDQPPKPPRAAACRSKISASTLWVNITDARRSVPASEHRHAENRPPPHPVARPGRRTTARPAADRSVAAATGNRLASASTRRTRDGGRSGHETNRSHAAQCRRIPRMVRRRGGGQRHIERAAFHRPQNIARADFAALVHREQKPRADKQQP